MFVEISPQFSRWSQCTLILCGWYSPASLVHKHYLYSCIIYNYRFIYSRKPCSGASRPCRSRLRELGHIWSPYSLQWRIMSAMAYQIIAASIVYSTVCLGADQRKHQSSASLAFVGAIHRWPVNSPHKWPVTRKMFSFYDVIIYYSYIMLSQTDQMMTVKFSSAWKLRYHWSRCWRQCQIAEYYRPLVHISRHDVIKWKQFPLYVSSVREIYRFPVDSLHKGPVMWSFDFSISLNKASSRQ